MALLRGIYALFALACTLGQLQVAMAHTEEGIMDEDSTRVSFCDDDGIWAQIAVSSEKASILGIPWNDLFQGMNNYVTDTKTIISGIQRDIDKLQAEIQSKAASTSSALLSSDQIQKLIERAITNEASYATMYRAKQSKCGMPRYSFQFKREQKTIPYEASDDAKAFIRAEATTMLKEGAFKTAVNNFKEICLAHLEVGVGETDLENWCEELCSGFANVVQDVSDQHSRSQGSPDRLKAELRKKTQAKTDEEKKRDRCKASITSVQIFHDQLKQLDDTIAMRHKEVVIADQALDAAQWALYTLEQVLDNATAKASAALATLQEATTEKSEAEAALQLAEQQKTDFQEVLANNSAQIDELKEALKDAEQAEESFIDVKKAVSMTMKRMALFFDQTVRSKVRDIGVDKNMAQQYTSLQQDVFAHFRVDTRKLRSAEQFKSNLHDFHSYCKGPALKMFSEIKNYIDLTELCNLQEENATAEEVHSAVEKRIQHILGELTEIKTWQDPYKGLIHMSQEAEKKLVEDGEPMGLRQVMTVYGDTDMYRSYLKSWKIDGPFLKLLDQLKHHVDELQTLLQQVQATGLGLQDKFAALTRQQEDAAEKVQKALDKHAIANDEAIQTKSVVADLKQAQTKAAQDLTDLENALRIGMDKYYQACTALTVEHATYTKMIEDKDDSISLLDATLP